MPVVRPGRTAPLRGPVALIVCLACAAAAAGPLVPPDETAGLSPVAACPARADRPDVGRASAHHFFFVETPHDVRGGLKPTLRLDPPLPLTPPGSVPLSLGRGVRGEGREWTHFAPCTISPLAVSRALSRRETASGPPSEQEATDAFAPLCGAETLPADPSALFAADAALPPVVRGQSPEIELLPLATGATPVENTSLLRWVTGTTGRLRGDYLTDFDETDRIGVHLLTQGWLGLGLDAEANYWQRPVAGLGREPLWTGDLNLIYNLVPHPRFKFRSGAGAAWTVDDGKPHAGYNVTHGLDVYLLWRFMATGELDWGALDDDKLFRYRLALGLTFKSAEFYTGYESYKLGGERLDGWVNGVAIWY